MCVYIAVLTVSSTENHVGDTWHLRPYFGGTFPDIKHHANVRWGCLKMGLTPTGNLNGEWWECVIMIWWIWVKLRFAYHFSERHIQIPWFLLDFWRVFSEDFLDLNRALSSELMFAGWIQSPRCWWDYPTLRRRTFGLLQWPLFFLLRKYPKISVHVHCLHLFVQKNCIIHCFWESEG